MAVEWVRVGEVLELQRRPIAIDPLEEYRLIGVYSFGKGIFHREARAGSELGDYRYFSVEPGDLVLSNIQAWEGAIAFATDRDLNTIGTHRFLTYRPTTDRIDANWARWFLLSEPGMTLIRKAAPGTTMRNRTLAIERFEALQIPLPSPDEQQAVAAKLDHVKGRTYLTARAQGRAEQLDEAALDASVWKVFEQGIASGWPTSPLGDIAEINPGRDRLDDGQTVGFVPMAAVDALTGTVRHPEERREGELRSGYKQFRQGDVIFARITPCMQNGKTAVFEAEGHAYGSTEFHVVRPGPDVHACWIHRFLRTRHFREHAKALMTGTAGQQRVSAQVLRDAPIPVPPRPVQVEVVSRIDRLLSIGQRLHVQRTEARTLVDAILPAAVNEAFGQFR